MCIYIYLYISGYICINIFNSSVPDPIGNIFDEA